MKIVGVMYLRAAVVLMSLALAVLAGAGCNHQDQDSQTQISSAPHQNLSSPGGAPMGHNLSMPPGVTSPNGSAQAPVGVGPNGQTVRLPPADVMADYARNVHSGGAPRSATGGPGTAPAHP